MLNECLRLQSRGRGIQALSILAQARIFWKNRPMDIEDDKSNAARSIAESVEPEGPPEPDVFPGDIKLTPEDIKHGEGSKRLFRKRVSAAYDADDDSYHGSMEQERERGEELVRMYFDEDGLDEALHGRQKAAEASFAFYFWNACGSVFMSLGKDKTALLCMWRARDLWAEYLDTSLADVARLIPDDEKGVNSSDTRKYYGGKDKTKPKTDEEKETERWPTMTRALRPSLRKPHGMLEAQIKDCLKSLRMLAVSANVRKRDIFEEFKYSYNPHPISATMYAQMGCALYHLDKYTLALKCFNAARLIRYHSIPSTSQEYIDMATTLNNMGACCMVLRQFSNANIYFRGALDIIIEKTGEYHPRYHMVETNLQRLYPRLKNIGPECMLLRGKSSKQVFEEMKGVKFEVAQILAAGVKKPDKKKKKRREEPKKKKKKKTNPIHKKIDAALALVSPKYYQHIIQTNILRRIRRKKTKLTKQLQPPPPARRRPNTTLKVTKPKLVIMQEELAALKKKGKGKKKRR
ncbi:hypothetical protein AAMO2058_001262700 [Amorphochlora amoebiformis]